MFVPDVVHCDDLPDIDDKLPELSLLNLAELYYNAIVFDVFENGFEKVKLFCLLEFIVFQLKRV